MKACATQTFNEMERRYEYITKLFDLLKTEQFSFRQEAQSYLALGCHVNSGGSDKASVAIMTCTMRAILIEMDIPESIISNDMITKAFPSRRSLKNLENRIGVGCAMLVCYEMAINNVRYISWTVDHGNRKDVDHFVKQISFASRDDDNNRVLRAYCIDANGAGHKACESADAIAITAELIDILVPGLVHDSATSDSGGGGAIQYLLPLLQEKGMMSADARKNHCDLHSLNKASERATTKTFSTAGIGHNSPLQLLHLSSALLKEITKQYTKKNLDKMWTEVNKMILSSDVFQSELAKYGGSTFAAFFEELENTANELESETVSVTTKNSSTTAPNPKMPLTSRWLTVFLCIQKFLPYYFTLYVLALHIRSTEKCNSLLHTYACSLLSLMRIKSDKASDNNDDNDSTSPPVLYVVLLFLDAFDDAFFNEHFKRRMRHNPDFGIGAYGFLSPYCGEHSGFMNKELLDLENGGFKTHPAFAKYRAARDAIPNDSNVGGAESAFFDMMESIFFSEFRAALKEHCLDHWRDDSHLPYLLGGSPGVMRALLSWLHYHIELTAEQIGT